MGKFLNRKKYFFFSFLIFSVFTECKVLDLSHPCDINSEAYFKNSVLVQFLGLRSAGCYAPYLPGPTSKKRASLWGFYSLNAGAGLVRDVRIFENKAYVGGIFDYIGPNTGSLAMLKESDQSLLPESSCPYFELDGSINTIIGDGSGNAIIGGAFGYVLGVKRQGVAKIKSDCTLDTTFNVNFADATAEVRTLLVHNGKLYIGGIFTGTFTTSSSETRNNIAAVNPETGALDTSWNPNVAGEVNALRTDGTDLFIGGNFGTIGITTVNNLAKVDFTSGTTVSTLGEPDSTVQTIEIDGSNLYVGGNFTTIAGNTTNYIAKISNTGSFAWGNSNFDSNVYTIQLSNNKLYVGGNFSNPRQGLITLDPSTGNDLVKDFKISYGNVSGIRELDNKLFLFGSFLNLLDAEPSYIACLDPTNDTITSWNAKIAGPNSQERGGIFKFSNGNYLIGGSFPTLQGKARTYLAEIDLLTGQPTDWNPSFTIPGGVEVIQAMHIYQNKLYIGGSFTAINSSTRTRFAVFDLSDSTPKLNDLNISISGYTNTVRNISDIEGRLLVSGGFTTVSGTSINHIFTLDPISGLTTFNLNPNTNFGINAFLKLSNGKFLIAGDLTMINGSTTVNRFAVVNESNGTLLQSPTGSNIGITYRLLESNQRLFVAFDNNTAPASSGCCLGIYDIENFNPISHSLDIKPLSGGRINDIYAGSNEIFLMGSFTSARSEIRKNFISFSTDTLQLTDFSPTFSAEINKMTDSSTDYYFVGRFLSVSGRKRAYFARIRKSDKSLTE